MEGLLSKGPTPSSFCRTKGPPVTIPAVISPVEAAPGGLNGVMLHWLHAMGSQLTTVRFLLLYVTLMTLLLTLLTLLLTLLRLLLTLLTLLLTLLTLLLTLLTLQWSPGMKSSLEGAAKHSCS